MKTLCLAIAATLAAIPAAAQDARKLVGRWESVSVTSGGIGEMIEVTENRKFIQIPGALVRGVFTADSLLRITTADGKQQVRIYEVKGDTLIVFDPSGVDVRFLRTRESQSREGLVGIWSFRTPTGGTGYHTFRADSTFRLWIPFRADTAEYIVRRNMLTLRNGRFEAALTWVLNDVGLELQRDVARGPTQARSYIRERQ